MLLTAWVEDSTQTVMAATEVPPEEYEQPGDGFGVASKGYQQVTSWQVSPSLSIFFTVLNTFLVSAPFLGAFECDSSVFGARLDENLAC